MSTTTTTPTTTMRAVVHRTYGAPEKLVLRDVPVPEIGADEVLVRVHAAGVDPGVLVWLYGKPALARPASGFFRPRRPVLGRALAGRVEAVGSTVTDLAPGDEVWGEATHGAYAEYAAVPATRLARKPQGRASSRRPPYRSPPPPPCRRWTRARWVPAPDCWSTARPAAWAASWSSSPRPAAPGHRSLRPRQRRSGRSLGADHVVDYTRDDFTRSGAAYDVIIDLAGTRSAADYRRPSCPAAPWSSPADRRRPSSVGPCKHSPCRSSSEKIRLLMAKVRREDLDQLSALVESGHVVPAVDTVFRLEDAPAALRRLEDGHVRGKLVVRCGEAGS